MSLPRMHDVPTARWRRTFPLIIHLRFSKATFWVCEILCTLCILASSKIATVTLR